jgi:hypothetical protein
MNATDGSPQEYHEPGRYEIRLKGHLDERWAERFEGLTLSHDDGTTILVGQVVDQAALYGLLRKVRDLGLPLLAVVHIGPEQVETPPGQVAQTSEMEANP